MNSLSNSIAFAALALALSATGAAAQDNNPGDSGGIAGPKIAMPTYPPGANDPALSPGWLSPKVATSVPRDENPDVPGATGMSIVPGDRSSIASDLPATIQQRFGGFGADNGGA